MWVGGDRNRVTLVVPHPVQCLSRLNKPKEGLELLNHAIKLDPKMPVARFNKAVALTATGQLEVRGEGRRGGRREHCLLTVV